MVYEQNDYFKFYNIFKPPYWGMNDIQNALQLDEFGDKYATMKPSP